ncbi:hypothetical protein GQ55_2G077500 [Panicum hallii var. hallii]|uniref:Uncharacterized protein n=1 Tax=Panicum hallii var. hallii TaxID=1504633 RepID=A0A2T7EMK7_9POAL|nr:hypothetical protein GQ55_2G077500 [Panicum hallii var. hallii]
MRPDEVVVAVTIREIASLITPGPAMVVDGRSRSPGRGTAAAPSPAPPAATLSPAGSPCRRARGTPRTCACPRRCRFGVRASARRAPAPRPASSAGARRRPGTRRPPAAPAGRPGAPGTAPRTRGSRRGRPRGSPAPCRGCPQACRRRGRGRGRGRDEVVGGVAGRVGRVEASVKDGDGETARVEEAGELEHGVDVALEREREEQHAAAAVAGGRVS